MLFEEIEDLIVDSHCFYFDVDGEEIEVEDPDEKMLEIIRKMEVDDISSGSGYVCIRLSFVQGDYKKYRMTSEFYAYSDAEASLIKAKKMALLEGGNCNYEEWKNYL